VAAIVVGTGTAVHYSADWYGQPRWRTFAAVTQALAAQMQKLQYPEARLKLASDCRPSTGCPSSSSQIVHVRTNRLQAAQPAAILHFEGWTPHPRSAYANHNLTLPEPATKTRAATVADQAHEEGYGTLSNKYPVLITSQVIGLAQPSYARLRMSRAFRPECPASSRRAVS